MRLVGATGVGDHWLTVPLLGAFPWFALLALITAVVLVVGRLRGRGTARRAGAAVVVALLGVAMLLPRSLPVVQPPATGEIVTVAVVNVRIGGADVEQVAALALARDADLLAVVEATPEFSAALRESPLGAALPTHEHATTDLGGIVLATGSLEPLSGLPHAGGTPDVAWTTPGGSTLAVTTVHAPAPVGADAVARWQAALARTPRPDAGPSLVLGDLNATVDHRTLRTLLATGWRDAAGEVGAGLSVTYDGLVDASPALPMAIDHALVSPDIAVLSSDAYDVAGTDHRLLVTTLRLP